MACTLVICLPTYNEAENIAYTVKAILRASPQAAVLITDDNSPDGTGAIADQMAQKDPRISVIHRSFKQGLGKAYCEGFYFAIERLGADLIGQMDADFSHSPELLPRMIAAARTADLVIGSRYTAGGGTKNWNTARRMISRFGSLYARALLGLPVSDPTGGFKIWRRETLRRVLNFPISSGGYVFQVETTYYAHRMGARIVEEPICFVERESGKSKMTPSIAFEAFWRIPVIRLRKNHT